MNFVRFMHCEFCRTFIIPCPVSYTNLMLIWRTKSSEMCCVLTSEQIPALWRSVLPPSSWSSSVLLHCWTLLIAGAHSSKPLVTVYQLTGLYILEGLLWKPQISNVLSYFCTVNLSVINISWREVLYTHYILPCSIKQQHKYNVHEYILGTKRRCFTLWVTGLVFKF
jgi:hypothetical protein